MALRRMPGSRIRRAAGNHHEASTEGRNYVSEVVCPLCRVAIEDVIHAGRHVLALQDALPITPGHCLIVPRRHFASWTDATPDERRELIDTVDRICEVIKTERQPDGFNVGWNDGSAAGQTVFHLHIHVIPRYVGDVADPRGGLRHIIPQMASHWTSGPHATRQSLVRGEDDPLLPHLLAHLDISTKVDIAVAFVLRSGIELLIPHLEDLVGRGGKARIVTGDYLYVSDPDALQLLLDLSLATQSDGLLSLRIFETASRGSFHPKAYLFFDDTGPTTAYVGSSNISAIALNEGLEWNYRILSAQDRPGLEDVARAFQALYEHGQTKTLDQKWLDAYRARRRPPAWPVETPVELPPPPPEPHEIQLEALRLLEETRAAGNSAGLVVLATGLGKTWLSAFDSNRAEFPRVLFVAHREEILAQALKTFRSIRPDAHLGKYTGEEKIPEADVLFASIQTLGRSAHLRNFDRDRFDYVVVDEFHHAAAATYRRLIDHFAPKFLLGLTATPERTDGGDLLGLCQENLVYRCDLFDGIRRNQLSPFSYFGVPDDVDYEQIPWRSTRFDEVALTEAVATKKRAQNALEQWRKHGTVRARTLGFCCSIRHADFMADYFLNQGVRAVAVHAGATSAPRASSLELLQNGERDVIFAVDMFNEGVDLPSVDTILMLRPTESRVLWLQQFGRGLRKAEDKERLTVVDYIGNHKVFLVKPQALFGIGSDRRELARMLDQYESGGLDLPDGCDVTYDLEAKNILRAQIGPTLTAPEALRTFYQDFKDREGRRPTAAEALHEGYSPRSVRQAHGSWLGFVADQGDLSRESVQAKEATGEFLTSLECTPMTRSYKMLLPLAMLNCDALPGALGIDELTDEFARVTSRSAQTRNDVSVPLDDKLALRALIEQNPIQAWVTGDGTGGKPYFEYDDNTLRFIPTVADDVRTAFQELVREQIDWRMAEYLRRSQDTIAPFALDCKVAQTDSRPSLVIPNRETEAEVPIGWTPIEIGGSLREANFEMSVIKVVRALGSEENQLPAILEEWFGPDVGRPGTDFRVLLERREGRWHATPRIGVNRRATLQVGQSYRREDVASVLGTKVAGQTWQSGVVPVGNRRLLFVTLNKKEMDKRYGYKDKFMSRDLFQWQSQNRTAQSSSDGRKIRDPQGQRIEFHLFARKEGKERGITMPFFYCGLLEFVEWEGEKPITVRWRLKQPLTDSLFEHLRLAE